MAKKKKVLQLELTEPESAEPKSEAAPKTEISEIEDPIGDVTDGEAETANEAGDESATEIETEAETGPEFNTKPGAPADGSSSEGWKPRPPAKLERLQKILAAAGVASRRSAEKMIEQGRVQVNGKVVTVLGTKADAGRDHIRVDGKLLQGAERLRYFVLNKPRGFVTTVKDPEGRPTVMQFFDKMKERLYPVGRLDYMSEGLLVVTNDGELANRLTKASSGVEKTYLVKVAGQPTEAELDILRGGVAIERGKPGSPQVRTSPARIRQVRQGDNPWYEVVLIEGRNRELRKMFEEVGHFVEKIRRVGYGPLVLDQEPGNLRELEPAELDALRKAAEGKLRTPKSKELRRRNLLDAGLLPTVLPKPSSRPRQALPLSERPAAIERPSDYRPRKNFGAARPSRPAGSFDKSAGKPFRPAWKKDDHPTRPPARFAEGSTSKSRPGAGRSFTTKPAWKKPERPAPDRSDQARSGPARPVRSARPEYKRPSEPRRDARVFHEDLSPVRPPNLHIEEITGPDRSSPSRPSASRPSYSRPGLARPFTTSSGKPRAGGARPSSKPFKPGSSKPTDRSKSAGWKPKTPRSYGPPSGPRAGSDSRPSYGAKRPYTPRTEGSSDYRPTKAKPYPNSASRAERKAGPGWKPKPSFSPGKPASSSRAGSRPGGPKPGGFSKSGYKAKPGGAKRTGPRPGGKPDRKRRS